MRSARPAKFAIVAREMRSFLHSIRELQLSVSGDILRVHTNQFGAAYGFYSFQASNGWLQKFIRRHAVQRSMKLHDEPAEVCETYFDKEMYVLRELVKIFDRLNIYRADETGLLYSVVRSRSYLLSSECHSKVRGTKMIRKKNRLIRMMCTNSDGTQKLPLAFLGKSKDTRCFFDSPALRSH